MNKIVLTLAVGFAAAGALTGCNKDPVSSGDQPAERPATVQQVADSAAPDAGPLTDVAPRPHSGDVADLMPAGWPATEAMRRAAEVPLTDAEPRDSWRDDVDLMPAGWPATEAMRRAAEDPFSDPAERAHWRHDAELMPAGWPATEVMRQAGE